MKLLERFATRQAARMMLCYIIISAIVGGTVGVITALGIRYFCDIDISIYIMVFAGVGIALISRSILRGVEYFILLLIFLKVIGLL